MGPFGGGPKYKTVWVTLNWAINGYFYHTSEQTINPEKITVYDEH